jgi:hypothetical protein
MLDHLEKFKHLDPKLRDAVSNELAMKALGELEARYGVSLADLLIRVMVKDIALAAMPAVLVSELKLDLGKADELYHELLAGVLAPALPYLENQGPVGVVQQSLSDFTTIEKPAVETRSSFMIDPEDEEEVKKIAAASNITKVEHDYEERVTAVMEKLKLSFGSEMLAVRLKGILVSYLKGVRNMLDSKQTMMRPYLEGGVQLDNKTADQIFALLQSENRELRIENRERSKPHISVNTGLNEIAMLGERDVAYDLSALAKKIPANSAMSGKLDQYSWRQPKEVVGKVMMADIKKEAPKVMGLLDELAFFDLVVFRRLSRLPEEATAKIKEKIELLELDSYHKRLEGIKAWRHSPLYKLYLRVSDESMKNNDSIEQTLKKFEAGKDNLSVAEFVAIMKLNKELRF